MEVGLLGLPGPSALIFVAVVLKPGLGLVLIQYPQMVALIVLVTPWKPRNVILKLVALKIGRVLGRLA